MSDRENELLENALDALDRLFDGHCGAVDVWALLVATRDALRDTPHRPALEQPLAELRMVVLSGAAADAQRDHALCITDPLRLYLARALPRPPAPLPRATYAAPGTSGDGIPPGGIAAPELSR